MALEGSEAMAADNDWGVTYVVWGKQYPELKRSVESVRQFDLPVCIISDFDVEGIDPDVLLRFTPSYPDCRCRAEVLYELTPWQTTLQFDSATVMLDDPTFGFAMAQRFGVACTHAPALSATRWHHLECHGYPADMPQYQAGALFFTKRDDVDRLFRRWRKLNALDMSRFGGQDQPGLAAACHELRFNPYVLPRTWCWRPHVGMTDGFGPIKLWVSKLDPPTGNTPKDRFWKMQHGS
jgi:hypothetical protein